MSIRPVPEEVAAQIRSSAVITSLGHVVCGLLKNSLDAEASKVQVTVDFSRGNCTVEDNGGGILLADFEEDGGLGRPHYTSKYPPRSSVHGRHGLFLSSCAALSLLSVTSRHADASASNAVSFHNGKLLTRYTPCPAEHMPLSHRHGTRIAVRDLFGSMPVRVKHRALLEDRSSSHAIQVWDQLVRDVVAHLLAWSKPVTVTLQGGGRSQSLRLNSPGKPARSSPTFHELSLLRQASLCQDVEDDAWVRVGASTATWVVQGYVCLQPVATKRVQFLNLGIGPVGRQHLLYDEVNKVFAASDFGLIDDHEHVSGDSETRDARAVDEAIGRKKGLEKWPMLVLHIERLFAEGRQGTEAGVNLRASDHPEELDDVLGLLQSICYEFLKKHHFRPQRHPGRAHRHHASNRAHSVPDNAYEGLDGRQTGTCRSHKRPHEGHSTTAETPIHRRNTASPFDTWSRLKSGQPLPTYTLASKDARRPASASAVRPLDNVKKVQTSTDRLSITEPPDEPLFDEAGKLLRRPFGDPAVRMRNATVETMAKHHVGMSDVDGEEGEQPTWMHPVTRKKSLIDPRTGFVKPAKRRIEASHAAQSTTEAPEKPFGIQEWARGLLQSWHNPIFETVEHGIARAHVVDDALGQEVRPATKKCCNHHETANQNSVLAAYLQTKLTKEGLKGAKLISQVDGKFLLVKVPSPGFGANNSDVLVLIDQHAADERCRVEDLMKHYFQLLGDCVGQELHKAVTQPLAAPLCYELSSRERDVLDRCRPVFAHWGLVYALQTTKHGDGERTQLKATSLPPSITERCRAEPRLLIDVIRTEACRLAEDPSSLARLATQRTASADTEDAWLSRFHGCPEGILEVLHSRACRSSVMFNDVLSRDECGDLLERLTRCTFPFQCAHGRPSMVPLVLLDNGGFGNDASATSDGTDGISFGEAFRKWRTTA